MNKRTFLFLTCALSLCLGMLTVGHTQNNGNGNGNGPDSDIIKHRIKDNNGNGNGPDTSLTAGTTGTVTPQITYHNGPLISTPVIYYIWYGNWNQAGTSNTAAGQKILQDFARTIGGSSHYAINTSYSTNGYTITSNVLFGGETTVGYTKGTSLSDAQIQQVVFEAINHTNGNLPYDASGVYFVLTSSDVTASSGFCTQYCGWHTSAASTFGGRVRYSFVGNAARCISSCAAQATGPNGNGGVDGMVSIITHELEESATDADPGSAPGWYDRRGAENADKCAWTFGSAVSGPVGAQWNVQLGTGTALQRNYLIQRNLKFISGGSKCYVNNAGQQ